MGPVDGFWPVAIIPLIAGLAVAVRAVSASGALAGSLLSVPIALYTGWAGVAMLATLLVVGTAISARGHGRRDALQALCNGGAAAAAALAAGLGLLDAAWGGAAVAGALAAALSDTTSGELGQRLGGTPRALLFGPPLPPGADGGMSFTGTLLGVAAAALVPAVGLGLGAIGTARAALGIACAGFFGNLCDSVVGLLLQPRLGARGNDWTNLIATLVGGAVAGLCWAA